MQHTHLTLTAATLAAFAMAGFSQAAVIDLDDTTPTLTAINNTSANALRISAVTAGGGDGNRSPEVQFEIQSGGLLAGTYTATFDVFYIDKPDQQRASMRRASNDGDNSDFDERPISDSDLNNNVDLGQWYRVTLPVVVTGGDEWNGTFELKPTIFGNTNDAADAFDVWYDNVDVFDGSGTSVLANGPFTFEADTVGAAPANAPLQSNSAGQADAFEVVAIPEPASAGLIGVAGLMLLGRRQRV